MRKVESCKLDLSRARVEAAIRRHPVVKGTVIFKFERAERMRNALDCVFYGVREVVHRIDDPLVARMGVRCVANAVDDGVAHIDVGRRHIDFRTQNFFAVGKLALSHPLEQVEIFLNRTVAIGAFRTGNAETAARLTYLLCAQIANVRFAVLDEFDGALVHFLEIVACIVQFVPVEAEPFDVGFYAFHIFDVLFCGVGVVEAQIARAVILFFHSEVYAQRLCVTDVQISVGFGRKTSDNLVHLARSEVFVNNFFDKVS